MAKGVKKRGSKFRHNLTNRVKANKLKEKRKKKSHSTEKVIKESWDERKTARENLSSMSLAVNPNEVVPIKKNRRLYIDAVPLEGVPLPAMEIDNSAAEKKKYRKKDNAKAKEVLTHLEKDAHDAEEKLKLEKAMVRKHHLPDRDIELVIYFLEKYGDDHTAMARDSRNLFQHTPKQIKKLINIFKESPMYKAISS